MPTLRGMGGKVYLAPNASSAAVPIGEARAWSFDIQQDLIENTQGFGSIWKTFLIASTGWRGSIEGNFDTSDVTPFSAADQPAAGAASGVYGPVAVYLYPSTLTMARFYSGAIWPNLTVRADLKQVIRFSMPFIGNGPLYRT